MTCASLRGTVLAARSVLRHTRHTLPTTPPPASNHHHQRYHHSSTMTPSPSASLPPQLDGAQLGTVELQDGRRVSYSQCGSKAGDAHPVLFLHPVQGNRSVVAGVARQWPWQSAPRCRCC